jgi:hypothetical protein
MVKESDAFRPVFTTHPLSPSLVMEGGLVMYQSVGCDSVLIVFGRDFRFAKAPRLAREGLGWVVNSS